MYICAFPARSHTYTLHCSSMVLYIRNLGFKQTPCLYRLTKTFCYLSLLNHFKIITKRTIQIVLFSYNTLPLIPPCLVGPSTVIMIICRHLSTNCCHSESLENKVQNCYSSSKVTWIWSASTLSQSFIT